MIFPELVSIGLVLEDKNWGKLTWNTIILYF